jgi:DNA-binding transcriptional MerR regulator
MTKKPKYSPVDICQIFDISKSTLLRWEREGSLNEIKRDIKTGEREYTQADSHIIYEKLTDQLRHQYERSLEAGDTEATLRIHERAALQRLVQGDIFIGLETLAELDHLSDEAILQLLQIATEHYAPTDSAFCKILEVAYKQSFKRTG